MRVKLGLLKSKGFQRRPSWDRDLRSDERMIQNESGFNVNGHVSAVNVDHESGAITGRVYRRSALG